MEKGIEKERFESLLRILTKRLGEVPSPLNEKLYAIHDLDVLGQLADIALDCKSFGEFEKVLGKY